MNAKTKKNNNVLNVTNMNITLKNVNAKQIEKLQMISKNLILTGMRIKSKFWQWVISKLRCLLLAMKNFHLLATCKKNNMAMKAVVETIETVKITINNGKITF